MTIREQLEQREKEILSPYAALSANSKGRARPEDPCDIRPVYQRDRDRILYSKAFRRMKHKTQVFLDPVGDHYRTRMTHALEVAQTARTIGKALRLNEDLIEAIALGHDLGHPPYGHAGERALNEVCSIGFRHNEQSLRIVDLLENEGRGLNLTWEVRDGIVNHKTEGSPATMEGQTVRIADKIAYLHHDIDDAIRACIISENDIPMHHKKILGSSTKDRLDTLVHDVIEYSGDLAEIRMSPERYEAMMGLREFMFDYVYTNPMAKGEERKAKAMLQSLFEHYMDYPEEMPADYFSRAQGSPEDRERSVCDYISGMTDQYAIEKFQELYIPKSWSVE